MNKSDAQLWSGIDVKEKPRQIQNRATENA